LSKDLEKELIDSKLSELLSVFKTKDLDLDALAEEVEQVSQGIYDQKLD
jgi:predicted DNA-binding protein YlxM (UPF0122 family)